MCGHIYDLINFHNMLVFVFVSLKVLPFISKAVYLPLYLFKLLYFSSSFALVFLFAEETFQCLYSLGNEKIPNGCNFGVWKSSIDRPNRRWIGIGCMTKLNIKLKIKENEIKRKMGTKL